MWIPFQDIWAADIYNSHAGEMWALFSHYLRGNKGSNKLRRPQGKPQMTSAYKASAYGVLLLCPWFFSLQLQGLCARLHHFLWESAAPHAGCTPQVHLSSQVLGLAPEINTSEGTGATWFMSTEVEKMSNATKYNSFTLSFLWLILMSLKKGFYFNQVLR